MKHEQLTRNSMLSQPMTARTLRFCAGGLSAWKLVPVLLITACGGSSNDGPKGPLDSGAEVSGAGRVDANDASLDVAMGSEAGALAEGGGEARGGGLDGVTALDGSAEGVSETGDQEAGASTGPVANDSIGQDPFARTPASGILVTSCDSQNDCELLLAADSQGGLFIAGATRNPKAMGLPAFAPDVVSEAFAARLDAQGKLLWSVPLKNCGAPADIAAGPGDSVYIFCPYAPDQATVMPGICTASAVVEKLSGSNGKVAFSAQVKVPNAAAADRFCPYALGVDASGRSFVGGGYVVAPNSVERAMIGAVSAVGIQDWTVTSDGPAGDDPLQSVPVASVADVDVDSNGNVIFAGDFNMWMKLGTTQLAVGGIDAGAGDAVSNGFVGRMSTSGTIISASSFGGSSTDSAFVIRATAGGGSLVAGNLAADSRVGGKTVTGAKNDDSFVAQLSATGEASWSKVLSGLNTVGRIALAADGKVHVAGAFAKNELLVSYDPVADKLSTRTTVLGDAESNNLHTHWVVVTTTGAVYVSGSFKGTIDLGTGKLTTDSVSAFLWRMN